MLRNPSLVHKVTISVEQLLGAAKGKNIELWEFSLCFRGIQKKDDQNKIELVLAL